MLYTAVCLYEPDLAFELKNEIIIDLDHTLGRGRA